MTLPPSDHHDHNDRPTRLNPTWGDVLVSFAAMAALPLLLWAMSKPLVGAATLAVGAGLFVGTRRAYRLARCVRECRALTVDLGRHVHITVTRRCVCAELAA